MYFFNNYESMIKSIVFWTFFPFVIPQALKVKKSAPRFADAIGGDEGVFGKGESVKVLGIGDSIIAGVGTSHISKSWLGQTCKYLNDQMNTKIKWQKFSETGAKLAKINQSLLSRINNSSYDIILISVGVNDVTGLTHLSKWKAQLHFMLTTLKQQSPDSLIAISGIPPMHVFPLLPQPLRFLLGLRAKLFDEAIHKVVKEYEKVIHIPIEIDLNPKNFSDDGYHPSEYGCQKWGEDTAQLIVKHIGNIT